MEDGLDQSFTRGDIEPFSSGNGAIKPPSSSTLKGSSVDPAILDEEEDCGDLEAFSKALGLPLHSERLARYFRTIGRLFDLTDYFEEDQMAYVALNPPLTTSINEAIKAVSNSVLIRVLEGEYPSLRTVLSIELELPKNCDQMERLISLLDEYIYWDEWDLSLELVEN